MLSEKLGLQVRVILIKKLIIRAWEIAQFFSACQSQHEDLSLIPVTHIEKLAVVMVILVISELGEGGQADSWVSVASQTNVRDPASKNNE